MKKIENKKLIEAIKIMKENNTKKNRSIMLEEMMKSEFLNPTSLKLKSNKDGKAVIKEGEKISFYTISTIDNKKFAMAFTSIEEMNKWSEKNFVDKAKVGEEIPRNFMIMKFIDYANIILQSNSNLDGNMIFA